MCKSLIANTDAENQTLTALTIDNIIIPKTVL